jgi:ribosomal protein L25 (general stress protein Ctc)
MKEINVTGQKRTDLGKKASKTLRKEGLIPCNLYGEKKGENGAPEALSFAVPFAELRKIIYTPHVYVINLIIDGESHDWGDNYLRQSLWPSTKRPPRSSPRWNARKPSGKKPGLKKQKISPSVLALCRYRGRFFVYLY